MKIEGNRRQEVLQILGEWPIAPGVYLMKDQAGRILYIGKAKNIRNRIRSYFQAPEKLTPKTRVLVRQIYDLEFTVTQSELEALLLECNLIKKHRPRYNIRLKDDKNYPYFTLDFSHPFPQFKISRKVVVHPNIKYFGPFNAGSREISRFLLKTFQIRDCSDAKFKNRTRPCLNYEIGTCTAPCVDYVDETQYMNQVHEAILFLRGKHRELLQTLRAEMKELSEKMEYERAKTVRDKIVSIEKIQQKQQAVLANPLNIDVIGLDNNEAEVQWVLLFVRSGLLTGRRAERGKLEVDTTPEMTRSFLEQYYSFALIPDEVWLFEDIPGRDTLERYLRHKAGRPVRVLVKRGEGALRLLGMARENAHLLLQEKQSPTTKSMTEALQGVLGLAEAPDSIEGFDVSNLQGENPAVSLVHFAGERPLKSRYRLYHPKTIEGQNDFGMIQEVVERRFAKIAENPPPDLILIDGGKGQLNAALAALHKLKLTIPILSLAKARTDSAFTRKEIKRSEERIFVPNRKNPILLREGHPALRLLQLVRDEAHRFAISHHRRRRSKNALVSELFAIPGIGERRREKLLKYFGGLDGLRTASLEELKRTGLTTTVADKVIEHFRVSLPTSDEE
ncbi:MAG: excinuclease ABC subunit UvrC [Deltaproteobacteria bacterium]|nr:excinuclease ABC subunit UvrC [Deltaproteobacteria bacterium]MBI3293183.1 excinuclease ABC subunit UvrC [Deltaproteobacteria bacterium]